MKKTKSWIACIISIFAVLFWAFPAGATASPTAQVKEKADQVLKILNDPALKGNKEKRRQMVTNIVETMIDWPEVGRRALAVHWRKRTPQEKEEFITLFRDLLKRTYSEKLDIYAGEQIVYLLETIDGNRAIVKTKVINTKKGQEYTVDYRLIKRGEKWLGYDVVIEGISAVNNYRIQFNEVIVGSSYEALIKKMKNREFRIKESSKSSKEGKR
jgi:phospholipid transport system substrate-binding protein